MTPSNDGTSPLHVAIKYNCFEIVRYMIEEMNVNANEAKDPETNKITPMSIAVARGYLDIA